MRPPWATYGLVATLVGSGLLSAIPRMPGVDCLLATTGAACGSDLTAVGATVFVGAVGTLAAAVGGWNVLSTAR
jgi:hypothetical protein